MIEIKDRELHIHFPEIEAMLGEGFDTELARLRGGKRRPHWPSEEGISAQRRRLISTRIAISFQRTLRIPDDGKEYPLPAGLGRFPIEHVDDYADRLPPAWKRHGGVMIPLYQREALWLNFDGSYPTALRVGTGKVCCVTGEAWSDRLSKKSQNYLALPEQPWLDGYVVAKGTIRQFVATPVGRGATVEEQLTGRAEWNGMQLQAFPLKAEVYLEQQLFPALREWIDNFNRPMSPPDIMFSMAAPMSDYSVNEMEMGFGAGGRMKQEIYEDRWSPEAYCRKSTSRCFVHLLNARQWQTVTDKAPPVSPVTEESYRHARLPWFLHYSEQPGVEASEKLAGIRSVEDILDPSKTGQPNLDGDW
ncbi:MAG: hypothetical protein JJT96_17225 [Opitutales bacterium]|nr:hypothetical protein [Opitutales bacterium]